MLNKSISAYLWTSLYHVTQAQSLTSSTYYFYFFWRSRKLAPVHQTEATRLPRRFVSVRQGTEDKLSAVQ